MCFDSAYPFDGKVQYFITDGHFRRSRRFITLAVFHFQIEMSRNYPISLFVITSNAFSV